MIQPEVIQQLVIPELVQDLNYYQTKDDLQKLKEDLGVIRFDKLFRTFKTVSVSSELDLPFAGQYLMTHKSFLTKAKDLLGYHHEFFV